MAADESHETGAPTEGLTGALDAAGRPDGGKKAASFLVQLLTIVRDESPLVSMNAGELSIHDPAALERKMSLYFRHSKFSSFLRQLTNFGFRKTSIGTFPSPCVYVHDALRGRPPEAILTLTRKSAPPRPAAAAAAAPSTGAPDHILFACAEQGDDPLAREAAAVFGDAREHRCTSCGQVKRVPDDFVNPISGRVGRTCGACVAKFRGTRSGQSSAKLEARRAGRTFYADLDEDLGLLPVGELVLADVSGDGDWIEGRVASVRDAAYDINFLNERETQTVPADRVKTYGARTRGKRNPTPMDLEEEEDRAAPRKPATAKTLPPVGAALEPFADVAEAFDPADADDGAAAPEKNEDAHATWLVVLLEAVRQHDYGRRQDLGDGYIRDGSTPLKTFARQLDLPLGDALRWYYGTLKGDASGYADYKKACRVAWNEACDRVDSDDEPLTNLIQPQLKPRRRDKATAAARRAWAQIAKPVTEETFTAWYIANVAKEKRDAPAPAPPARKRRKPAPAPSPARRVAAAPREAPGEITKRLLAGLDRVEAKPAAECVDESMPRILAFRAIDNRSTTGKSSEGAIRSLIKGLDGVDPGLLRRCLEGRSFSQRGAQQLSVNHELRGAATVLGMAPDAKVIVLRGDRVTVETIVSFVAGHAEGIGAADPVRRLAPPWPAAQETNQVRALAAAAAPRSLVPLADDGTGWAYVAVGDEPDEFVAEWTGTDDVSFSTAISRDAASRAEPVLPAGTLARCASAPALRRVLPPYCLVDEHDPRALQPGEAAADSLHSSVAWYCTFDNDTLQRIASKFEPRTTAVEIWAANAHRSELQGLAKPNPHRKQKGGFTRSELFNARMLLLIPLNGPPPERQHTGGACKACASGPQRHKLKQHTCAGYYARVDTDDAATNAAKLEYYETKLRACRPDDVARYQAKVDKYRARATRAPGPTAGLGAREIAKCVSQLDAAWSTEGHALLRRRVRRHHTSGTVEGTVEGLVVAWLPETTKDPFLDPRTEQPAPLFRVLYRDTRVGDEDLELHEVNASLQKELKRPADADGPPAKRPNLTVDSSSDDEAPTPTELGFDGDTHKCSSCHVVKKVPEDFVNPKTKRVGKTCAECITRARWNVSPALPAAKTSGRTRTRRQADVDVKPKSSSSKLPCRRGCGRSFKNAGARTKHEAACAHGRDTEEAEDANDDLIGQKVINVFPGAGGFRMGFVRERVDPRPGSVRIGNYMCVWHDHTFTEHQAGKIRNKLLREWEWAEVPAGEISPTFRELYKEHVGDRYGDADGSSRGRTVTTPLFGDPNALV